MSTTATGQVLQALAVPFDEPGRERARGPALSWSEVLLPDGKGELPVVLEHGGPVVGLAL